MPAAIPPPAPLSHHASFSLGTTVEEKTHRSGKEQQVRILAPSPREVPAPPYTLGPGTWRGRVVKYRPRICRVGPAPRRKNQETRRTTQLAERKRMAGSNRGITHQNHGKTERGGKWARAHVPPESEAAVETGMSEVPGPAPGTT